MMAEEAKKVGFNGIGTYQWGIHVDIRDNFVSWDNRERSDYNENI
jgi:hypothetical protein